MQRIQTSAILNDLDKKMVFLVGPRQVGKTWLARDIAKHFTHSLYLNFDQVKNRSIIRERAWLENVELLILDELHKMPDWKNYLQSVYDTKPKHMRILVTSSAQLDVHGQLGDSLAERYSRHRLLPLSLAELNQAGEAVDLDRLLVRGGFPEPYFEDVAIDAERWRIQYKNSLLSTDIFEFEKIHNIKAIQLIFDLLRHRVGSPISYQSLAEEVGISPTTVKTYIQILEALYIIFRVTPYAKNIARSLIKEPKIYFFDTGMVTGDEACKLENLTAVSLLKHVYARTDYHAEDCHLHYLRTKEGKAVDFTIITNQIVETLIEVKLSDAKPANGLHYFHQKYNFPAVQIVKSLQQEYRSHHIKILKAEDFLSQLFIIEEQP